jgi:hypothetical protein
VILARVFRRHCFVHRDSKISHKSLTRVVELKGLIPVVDRALERAKLIRQHYFPVPNPQPWGDVALGWDFRVERTSNVESEVT